MKRAVNHDAMSVVGYTTPWSAKAGQRINLSLSCDRPIKATRICRLDKPVPEFLAWPIETVGEARRRHFDQGSFLFVRAGELAKVQAVHDIRFELFLTRNEGARTILEAGALGLRLRDGAFVVEIGGETLVEKKAPTGVWLTVELDLRQDQSRLRIKSHDRLAPYELHEGFGGPARNLQAQGIHFGASATNHEPTLNAKCCCDPARHPTGDCCLGFPDAVTNAGDPDVGRSRSVAPRRDQSASLLRDFGTLGRIELRASLGAVALRRYPLPRRRHRPA
ncbi:hypothetical protein NKI41_00450 [Mesorhizobium sp. M0601]|uniref:hypothetical protein n=1 Tax=Mesorhizobium sp. M0601 TaxID=2956969 RepID=UPI00333D3787